MIDAGTSNTRVYLVNGQVVIGKSRTPHGIRDVALRGSLGAFSSALREGIDGAVADAARRTGKTPEELAPSMCIASGMITSELGLCEIPHLAAPAGLDDLASHVVARRFAGISPSPFVFIPGVKIPGDPFAEDPVASPDMMRGEETQIMGLLVNRSPSTPVLVTILGSHTKFIVVDAQGRISRSLTTLSGELIKAINSATILSSSLPRHMPDRRAASAELVRKGIRLAEGSGFTRSLFALRLLNRLSSLGPEDCFDLLAGVAAAEDLRALLTSGLLDAPLRTVLLAGNRHRVSVYRQVLQSSRILRASIHEVDEAEMEQATVRGAGSVMNRVLELNPEKIMLEGCRHD